MTVNRSSPLHSLFDAGVSVWLDDLGRDRLVTGELARLVAGGVKGVTTNPSIFAKGIERGIANAILIKVNQIGTLTETLEAIEMGKRAGYRYVVKQVEASTPNAGAAWRVRTAWANDGVSTATSRWFTIDM